VKRHLVASGATVLALCLGAGGALAADPIAPVQLGIPIQPEHVPDNPLLQLLANLLGIGDPPPGVGAAAGAVHAASSGAGGVDVQQAVPVGGAVAVSSPGNVDVPIGVAGGPDGAGRGAAVQASTSQATAAAVNDVVAQSSTPGEGGGGGGGAAAQSSAAHQVVPVAIGAAISAPVNLNLPIGVLASRIAGDVTQTGEALATASAFNNRLNQEVAGGGGPGSATQTSTSDQAVPIALGLAVAAPININLPIDILSGGGDPSLAGTPDGTLDGVLRGLLSIGADAEAAGGQVTQTASSQATAVAANNAVEQSAAGAGAASQTSATGQLIPAAVGAALSLPLNANLPVGVLQSPAGLAGEPVEQTNQTEAGAEAVNSDVNQQATQQGTGGTNTAAQSSENQQLLPIALATDLSLPIQVNLPITILGHPLFEDSTLDLSIVQRTLDAVDATIADPLGTLRHALLEDPQGTIGYLLNG
jgi:hypothetical protein